MPNPPLPSPSSSSPLVDVLIPVFNAELSVRASIESIQNQSLADIRMIVVNDGSSDGTLAILNDLASRDPRIHVVDVPNGGIVDALNAGLAVATADMIARHDGDDIAFSNRLQEQLAFLREHPDCLAVGSNARHIDAHGELTGHQTSFGCPADADPEAAPSREPYLLHPFMMARREAINAVGGYRYVFHAEDTDLYWRLQGLGKLHNLPAIHGLFRLHAESVTNKSILNGRIGALNAQLAAVSEQRRRARKPDLRFSKHLLKHYHEAETLDAMLDLVPDLDPRERRYVAVATAGKLMTAALFRPYELDMSDCRFARKALRNATRLSTQSRKDLEWVVATTARRLLAKKRYREFFRLVPYRVYPRVVLQHLKSLRERT